MAKLGDMGVSENDYRGKFYNKLAPVKWSAPEIFLSDNFGVKVDIFSLGLVMNYMFVGSSHLGQCG